MSPGDRRSQDELAAAVRRALDRRNRARAEGARTLARSLALAGVLGWTVVLPALAGGFAGRWLDRHLESGIFWSGSLVFAGLCAGCWLAWRHVRAGGWP